MPPQEMTKEQALVDQLQNTRNQLNNAHMTISHIERDLMFWKRLALKKLGVVSDDIRELVQPMGFGGVSGSTTASSALSRGY